MRLLMVIAAAMVLSSCADLKDSWARDLFRRTAANTAGAACRSMSNCYSNRRDALAEPRAWERGTANKPHHDPYSAPKK